jgi:hypothetical protein
MANFETIRVQMAHVKALDAAQKAAKAFADRHMNGQDGGACGFAWVDIYGVRSNSKMGKALAEIGFSKSYQGSLQQWNKWWPGQSVDAAEHGAVAYATVMKEELNLDRCYAGSRLD